MLQQLLHDVGRQVADMIGHRYHYKVVFDYVTVEVCGILKICLHNCNVAIKRMQSEVYFSYVMREQLRRIHSAKIYIFLYIKERFV